MTAAALPPERFPRLRALWHARALTIWFAVLYVLWVLRGVIAGYHGYHDHEATRPVVLHFRSSLEQRIDLRGNAQRLGLRTNQRGAWLYGDSTLEVQLFYPQHLQVVAVVQVDGAAPGDEITIEDESIHRRYVLRQLHEFLWHVEIPLWSTDSEIRFLPCRPTIRYRFHELHLEEPRSDEPQFTATPRTRAVRDDGPVSIRLGSGWWMPRDRKEPVRPDEELFTRRHAYLVLGASKPGVHRLRLRFRRVYAAYEDPVITVDGRRVVASFSRYKSWRVAEFEAPLAKESVLGLELRGRILSPYQIGKFGELSDDRALAYGVIPGALEVAPVD